MRLISVFIIVAAIMLSSVSCKKDSSNPEQGTLTIGITDTRSTQKAGKDIIDASKLTKFEITISKIELRTEDASFISVLEEETSVNLSNYQGNVKELSSMNVPVGKYTGVIIYFSGVSITYDGNNYTASTASTPVMTLASLPGTSFSLAEGIPNAFDATKAIDITFDFEIVSGATQAFNITFDAITACYEIEFDCSACTPTLNYFVGLRPNLPKYMNIYFKEGIQQIKYSSPLDIKVGAGATTASYYGIHTFVDFNGIGGNIVTHASQYVYRGTDGSLAVDAGQMIINNTALSPSSISATGQTDIRADEVFDFEAIQNYLTGTYTFESGKTYYFSLRKNWEIASGSTAYSIRRTCEPIPVVWP